MSKRRLKFVGIVLLVIIGLPLVLLLFERFRGQVALAGFKKELVAKGEKLSPQDFFVFRPAESNGAPAVWAAVERLQPGKVLTLSLPPQMKVLPSGRAIVGFREPDWIESGSIQNGKWVDGKVTNHWEQVASDLEANASVFSEIREAMKQPFFNNELDYAAGARMRIPHLASAKNLAQWLQGDIALALHEGRKSDALAALHCQIKISKLLSEDKILISELVRFAVAGIARANTWEALQFDGWSDEELSILQNAWAEQRFTEGLVKAVECELVSTVTTYEGLRASNDETYQMLETLLLFTSTFEFSGDGESEDESTRVWEKIPYHQEIEDFCRREIYCRIWRFAWAHQAECKQLKDVHHALTLMREGEMAKSHFGIIAKFDALKAADDYGPYNRIRFMMQGLAASYGKATLRSVRAESDRSLALCAIALKRHFLRHGKNPSNLDALVPEFLPAVPTDYMDGKPIKYRLNEDGSFTLYSVGQDGEDNGGDLALPEGSRTRDWWQRRDYVWPLPATPKEVEEYRREAARD